MALDRFAEDIVNRCRIAQADFGGHPNGAWSTGEKLAVALVLGDVDYLHQMEYTWEEATERVRGGMFNPPQNIDAWINAIRAELEL